MLNIKTERLSPEINYYPRFRRALEMADVEIADLGLLNEILGVFPDALCTHHGTGVTGSMRLTSDMDFVIQLAGQPFQQVASSLIPGINGNSQGVDYISVSTWAESGRRLSHHIQRVGLRRELLQRPYAIELRDRPKNGVGQSEYETIAVNQEGNVIILKLRCPQFKLSEEKINSPVINFTPQAGPFAVNHRGRIIEPLVSRRKEAQPRFEAVKAWQVDQSTGEIFEACPEEVLYGIGSHIFNLGLEFGKAMTDTPLRPEDQVAYIEDVLIYLRTAMHNLGKFAGIQSRQQLKDTIHLGLHAWAEVRRLPDGTARYPQEFMDYVLNRLDILLDFTRS